MHLPRQRPRPWPRASTQGHSLTVEPRLAPTLEAGVDVVAALRLRVVIVADPDLEGRGPMLTWDEE